MNLLLHAWNEYTDAPWSNSTLGTFTLPGVAARVALTHPNANPNPAWSAASTQRLMAWVAARYHGTINISSGDDLV